MMNVVAPEGAIKEGERVIVLSDLSGSDLEFWIVAKHGVKAGYVRNIADNPRVKLREGFRARWYTGTAHVLSDDDPRARQHWLGGKVPGSARNAATVRLFWDGLADGAD